MLTVIHGEWQEGVRSSMRTEQGLLLQNKGNVP